jgi:hypothetical protein
MANAVAAAKPSRPLKPDRRRHFLQGAAVPSDEPHQSAPPTEGDLGKQIDSLLTSATEAMEGADDAAASTAAQATDAVASAAAGAAPPAGGDGDLAGDELAKQIQELLDTAKESTEATPAHAAAGPDPAPEVSARAIEKIDEALAESADDAVAGDFETVAEADGQAGAAAAGRRVEDDVPDATQTEPDLEGGFSSPDALMQTPAAAGFSADARSVAQELDSQPENAAKPAKRDKPAKAKAPRDPRDPNAPSLLRRTLILINAPLLHASKQTRDLVGWVGLLTVFNASVLLMARTVFHVTGQPSADAAQVESHGEAKAEKATHGGEEGHGAKPKAAAKAKPKAEKKGSKKAAKAEHAEHGE